jgi:hypothetical protein
VKEYEALTATEEETVADLREQLGAAEPQSGERKRLLPKIDAAEQRLVQGRQMVKYFQLRSLSRVEYARKAYLKIFQAGGDWPDKAEYDLYLTNQKLVNSSKNWDTRVPKMKSPKDLAIQTKEKPKSGGGGGH